MYTELMIKFQITVPEGQMAEWKRSAALNGVSVAELIRQTMSESLRAKPTATDPFESITGLADALDTDLASRVDEILYA